MKFGNLRTFVSALALGALWAVPQTASAETFKGEYIGVEGGASTIKTTGNSFLSGPIDESNTDPIGVLLAGYRTPIRNNMPIVVGIEGEFGGTIDAFDTRFAASLIGGYSYRDEALLFARVGYASQSGLATGTEHGLMLGGGAEVRLMKHVNVRVEYKNMDYGSTTTDPLGGFRKYRGHEIAGGLILDF